MNYWPATYLPNVYFLLDYWQVNGAPIVYTPLIKAWTLWQRSTAFSLLGPYQTAFTLHKRTETWTLRDDDR